MLNEDKCSSLGTTISTIFFLRQRQFVCSDPRIEITCLVILGTDEFVILDVELALDRVSAHGTLLAIFLQLKHKIITSHLES